MASPRIHRHDVDDLSEAANDRDQHFARDIEWRVVGPMSPEVFLEKFLPCQVPSPSV